MLVFAIILLAIAFGIACFAFGAGVGYTNGQKDAIRGDVEWELVKASNGASYWVKL